MNSISSARPRRRRSIPCAGSAVASFELPLVVRLVEVEPYEKGNQPTTEAVSASTRASEDGPWVGRGTQKFTVILECIEAIDQSAGGDA